MFFMNERDIADTNMRYLSNFKMPTHDILLVYIQITE